MEDIGGDGARQCHGWVGQQERASRAIRTGIYAPLSNMQRRIRRRDLTARHHQDIIIMLNDLDQDNARSEAEQIAAALTTESPSLTAHQGNDPLTVTIGIGTFPADGHSIAALVEIAQNRSLHKPAPAQHSQSLS